MIVIRRQEFDCQGIFISVFWMRINKVNCLSFCVWGKFDRESIAIDVCLRDNLNVIVIEQSLPCLLPNVSTKM